jgi:adenosine deaminase
VIIDNRHAEPRRRAALAASAGIACLALLSLLPAVPATATTAPRHDAARSAAVAGAAARPVTPVEQRVAAYLRAMQGRPSTLRAFFQALPKGGDLHSQLSGAVSTEFLIKLAQDDGLCVATATMTAVKPPCAAGTRPASDAVNDKGFHDAIVRAWSMQGLPAAGRSGHDHFFDSFAKFAEVARRHPGRMAAEAAESLARQNQSYLETMVTPAPDAATVLAGTVGWNSDLAAMHTKLAAGGQLDKLVGQARAEADAADKEFRDTEHCGTDHAAPGCHVTVKRIAEVPRTGAPERVFTQMALGMRLAERDPRFVAVDLVQPEDSEAALRDYRLHMRMLDYLHGVYPRAHITLQAGELAPGTVKPEDLTFHIHDAVTTGHAERIGHGVDLRHENGWQDLARTMAQRHIAVEVPLTGDAQTLGVRGTDHPFGTYLAYGVPLVLATGAPGVSLTDITHEYEYAAATYSLTYPQLKDLARNSLEYAFLPGRSLWRSPGQYTATAAPCTLGHPSAACSLFLGANPKAALQWQQELAFTAFEQKYGQ